MTVMSTQPGTSPRSERLRRPVVGAKTAAAKASRCAVNRSNMSSPLNLCWSRQLRSQLQDRKRWINGEDDGDRQDEGDYGNEHSYFFAAGQFHE